MLKSNRYDPGFAEEVAAEPGGEYLWRCFSCGTCVATCPIRWWNADYNPRRIVRMIVLGLQNEVLSSPAVWFCSACDNCYDRCPQGVRISELMRAIRNIAIREGKQPFRTPAQVNERVCSACGLCVEVCPYDAIELVSKRVLGHEKTVAQVNALLCMGCGLCGASCRSAAIDVADFSDEEIVAEIRGLSERVLIPVEVMR